LITLAAGVAAVRGLTAATGLALELKWPNDIVIGRPWRKLAGILAESASSGPRIDAVVVGIGVNLRRSAFPPEIADRATAIEMETDRPVDGAACTVEVLAALAETTARLGRGEGAAIVDAWRQYGRAGLGGAAVRWSDEHGTSRGVARDVDETGALVVDVNGQRERVVSGEVQWERLVRD
jgi:BirA family biotin operon repressor/biotin-[acetyl-CoA-carboxylase] ligase